MSLFGGLGFSAMNALTPSALAAQQHAIDAYLNVQQQGLARQHDSIERQKDRDAQKAAAKKARQNQWMQMGVGAGVGALAGGVGAALAPALAAAPVAAGAATTSGLGTSLGTSLSAPIGFGAGMPTAAAAIPAATSAITPTAGAAIGAGVGTAGAGISNAYSAMPSAASRFGMGALGGAANAFAPGSGNLLMNAANPLTYGQLGLQAAHMGLLAAQTDAAHAGSEKTRALLPFEQDHLTAQTFHENSGGLNQLSQAGLHDASTNRVNTLLPYEVDSEQAQAAQRYAAAGNQGAEMNYHNMMTDRGWSLLPYEQNKLGAESYKYGAEGDNQMSLINDRSGTFPYRVSNIQSKTNLSDAKTVNEMMKPLGGGGKLPIGAVSQGAMTPDEWRQSHGLSGDAPFTDPFGMDLDRRMGDAANETDRIKIFQKYGDQLKGKPDYGHMIKKWKLSGY